jgi:hypothetical protein
MLSSSRTAATSNSNTFTLRHQHCSNERNGGSTHDRNRYSSSVGLWSITRSRSITDCWSITRSWSISESWSITRSWGITRIRWSRCRKDSDFHKLTWGESTVKHNKNHVTAESNLLDIGIAHALWPIVISTIHSTYPPGNALHYQHRRQRDVPSGLPSPSTKV